MSFASRGVPGPILRRILDDEERSLGAYALRSRQSRGRRQPQSLHPYRTEFMRDRDRVLHAVAFRRLMHKTQVFIGQPTDFLRSRLTHTLEVAGIARTLARALRLNEDLTEAVALAHDLGHPPFGHAGERALDRALASVGGFEHNWQGVRIVERLESRYPAFAGLNLCYETALTLAMRSKRPEAVAMIEPNPPARMLAEGQVVDLADGVAYNAHDLDDALRVGLISLRDVQQVAIWGLAEASVRDQLGIDASHPQFVASVIRSLIGAQVDSAAAESQSRLQSLSSPLAVQSAKESVVALAQDRQVLQKELQQFLFERVYRHSQVASAVAVGEQKVQALVTALVMDPSTLPASYQQRLGDESLPRVVGDYVAGMTDRFAEQAYRQRFGEPKAPIG